MDKPDLITSWFFTIHRPQHGELTALKRLPHKYDWVDAVAICREYGKIRDKPDIIEQRESEEHLPHYHALVQISKFVDGFYLRSLFAKKKHYCIPVMTSNQGVLTYMLKGFISELNTKAGRNFHIRTHTHNDTQELFYKAQNEDRLKFFIEGFFDDKHFSKRFDLFKRKVKAYQDYKNWTLDKLIDANLIESAQDFTIFKHIRQWDDF